MKPDERNEWSDHCLQEILQAVGSDADLKSTLVFKGARILNLHLGTHRQSLDIDSSLDVGFHDIVRILRSEPITARPFWEQAAGEFMLACESRYVDCGGLATFQEDWDATRVTYLGDPSLARIPWEEVGEALAAVVGFIGDLGIFPLIHPLPDTSPNETP